MPGTSIQARDGINAFSLSQTTSKDRNFSVCRVSDPQILRRRPLLEVLVVPYRVGDVRLAERYELLLTRSRGVRMVDVIRDQLRAAAQLRAATGVKTRDALQMVSALGTGCHALLTNDRGLPSVPGLRVVQLSSYVERE